MKKITFLVLAALCLNACSESSSSKKKSTKSNLRTQANECASKSDFQLFNGTEISIEQFIDGGEGSWLLQASNVFFDVASVTNAEEGFFVGVKTNYSLSHVRESYNMTPICVGMTMDLDLKTNFEIPSKISRYDGNIYRSFAGTAKQHGKNSDLKLSGSFKNGSGKLKSENNSNEASILIKSINATTAEMLIKFPLKTSDRKGTLLIKAVYTLIDVKNEKPLDPVHPDEAICQLHYSNGSYRIFKDDKAISESYSRAVLAIKSFDKYADVGLCSIPNPNRCNIEYANGDYRITQSTIIISESFPLQEGAIDLLRNFRASKICP